jgi:hypothetical protein
VISRDVLGRMEWARSSGLQMRVTTQLAQR